MTSPRRRGASGSRLGGLMKLFKHSTRVNPVTFFLGLMLAVQPLYQAALSDFSTRLSPLNPEYPC